MSIVNGSPAGIAGGVKEKSTGYSTGSRIREISVMPHSGHFPGTFLRTSGCMGQTYTSGGSARMARGVKLAVADKLKAKWRRVSIIPLH